MPESLPQKPPKSPFLRFLRWRFVLLVDHGTDFFAKRPRTVARRTRAGRTNVGRTNVGRTKAECAGTGCRVRNTLDARWMPVRCALDMLQVDADFAASRRRFRVECSVPPRLTCAIGALFELASMDLRSSDVGWTRRCPAAATRHREAAGWTRNADTRSGKDSER